MRFATPAAFWWLLVVPLLALLLAWAAVARRRALERFICREMAPRLTRETSTTRRAAKAALLVAAVLFAVLALAGPQFGVRQDVVRRRGADVVLVLDVSRSMLAEDVRPNRLERAKYGMAQLTERLRGDRIGLVLFAGQALVQCPLTLDHGALQTYLTQAEEGSVPVAGTGLAEAIRVAAKAFPEGSRHDRAVVAFTDGEDHEEDPVSAARQAAEARVRVYAVGVGTPEGELIPEASGGPALFHKDGRGNYVKTRLAEESLQQVASAGEGRYFRSTVGGGELDVLADELGHLDQRDLGTRRTVLLEERFQIPLFLSLLCLGVESCLSERKRGRAEWRGRFA